MSDPVPETIAEIIDDVLQRESNFDEFLGDLNRKLHTGIPDESFPELQCAECGEDPDTSISQMKNTGSNLIRLRTIRTLDENAY
ncbi:hypothetical protein AVEN_61564-1 [Araneus ventricosus]|uniref:Uncharacterized protein n=1 Tax=Araneus ventricosus TaxID=182803 RepID=A0A4Y2MH69_ARAVE|nr:hypothetical protein AVEN_61564-1 [Araneus ventricosus]